MEKLMTEQDVKCIDGIFVHADCECELCKHWKGIAARARALLVQRDALKAERDEAIRERDEAREHCSLMAGERDFYARQASESDDTIKRVTAERDTERTQRQEASADLFRMTQARDGLKECMREVKMLLFPEFGDAHVAHTRMVERVRNLLNTGVSAALTEFGFGDYQLAPVERVRQMGTALVEARGQVADLRIITAERDTLAARVKELEDRVKGTLVVNCTGLRERVAESHEVHVRFVAKDGTLISQIILGTENIVPSPDPRDAEIRALKDELAGVRGVREAIPGEGDLHVFSFLTKIREVLGCNKFGYDLVDAVKAMKDELETVTGHMNEWRILCEETREAAGAREKESVIYAVKALRRDAEFGRAALEHANALGIDTNKELGQQYRALRRDAEAWRRMFPYVHPDEASKIVVRYHFLDKDTKEVVVKDNGAPEYSSTAVNPAKPGLQPMKCPCGGQIEFGRECVGHCMNCGASCRVMDPPPTVPSCQPEGHMIHIPAEYCGDSSRMHAYADGYLAGKGAK